MTNAPFFSTSRMCCTPAQTKIKQPLCVCTRELSDGWARVDCASRAAKNSPPGCFCAVFCDSAAAVRIHPPSPEKSPQNRKSSTRFGYWISWWSEATQIRTIALWSIFGGDLIECDGFCAVFVVEYNQNFFIIEINSVHKRIDERFPMAFHVRVELAEPGQPETNLIFA